MVDTKPKNILGFLFRDLSLKMMKNVQRHFRRCSFSIDLHLKETKNTRVFGWYPVSPPWCNRKIWYCIKCMNLLTVSHRCLIHLIDYLYTEPFLREVEKRPTNVTHTSEWGLQIQKTKDPSVSYEEKGSPMFKVDLLTFLLVGNHDEITIWRKSLWLFSQPFSEQIPEWCSENLVPQKLDSSSVRSVGSKESSSRENASKPPFFQAQVWFLFQNQLFFALNRIQFWSKQRYSRSHQAKLQKISDDYNVVKAAGAKLWVWIGGVVLP